MNLVGMAALIVALIAALIRICAGVIKLAAGLAGIIELTGLGAWVVHLAAIEGRAALPWIYQIRLGCAKAAKQSCYHDQKNNLEIQVVTSHHIRTHI